MNKPKRIFAALLICAMALTAGLAIHHALAGNGDLLINVRSGTNGDVNTDVVTSGDNAVVQTNATGVPIASSTLPPVQFGNGNTITYFGSGTSALTSGSVVISNTNVTTNSVIIPVAGGTMAGNPALGYENIQSGTGFTIFSGSTNDTRPCSYIIIH